jgi:hypothetical protein
MHAQYLESGCNFEHDLGFRMFGNKHNLWPAAWDPRTGKGDVSMAFNDKLLETGVNANGGRISRRQLSSVYLSNPVCEVKSSDLFITKKE